MSFIHASHLEVLSLRLPSGIKVINIKLPLNGLITRYLQPQLLFLLIQYHGNHLDEVMVHRLVCSKLLLLLTLGDHLGHLLGRHVVLRVLGLVLLQLQFIDTLDSLRVIPAKTCSDTTVSHHLLGVILVSLPPLPLGLLDLFLGLWHLGLPLPPLLKVHALIILSSLIVVADVVDSVDAAVIIALVGALTFLERGILVRARSHHGLWHLLVVLAAFQVALLGFTLSAALAPGLLDGSHEASLHWLRLEDLMDWSVDWHQHLKAAVAEAHGWHLHELGSKELGGLHLLT